MTGLSIRRGFAWNFVGNTLYNLGQWLLVLALTHLASPSTVGQFSLSLAITAPVFLTVGMNLRNAQVTDTNHRFRIGEYLVARHILSAVAIVVSLLIALIMGLSGAFLWVVLAVASSKAVEALSLTYYGFFQQGNRLDLVSRSMMGRSIAGPTAFLGIFLLTDNLALAAVGLGLGWASVQLAHDRPHLIQQYRQRFHHKTIDKRPVDWRRLGRLVARAAPLGVDAGLSSLAPNLPRFAVQAVVGTSHLGVFASIAYLGQTVSMITSSMQAVVLPRLAVLHHEGRRRGFVRLLFRLAFFGLTVTAACVLGALLLGKQVLEILLPEEYVRPDLLVALMVGAGLTTLQRCLCKGIEAAQLFRTYVIVDAITTGSICAVVWPMTSLWGLPGAAWSLTVGFTVGCLAASTVLFYIVRAMPAKPPHSTIRSA